MAFTIRAASPTDLPYIATLDIAAHKPASALLNMNLLPPDDIHALYLSRYAHYLSQPDQYRFLVAVTSASTSQNGTVTHGGKSDIAGFLVGARPKVELESFEEEDRWKPVFPEDASVETLAWFLGLMKSMKEDKMKPRQTELEALATSPSYQHRGVASLLLAHWLQEVDTAHGTLYVRASGSGRRLYEKLGCVDKGEHSVDVSDHGWMEPIVNTNMIRAARNKGT
ncbi:hypothetical protein LCER1_G004185 [Lachnellula cervina]|uniref:N-acetyltransferase domain-containing protein n=1 Tax=Lachnellula cervina TaxID=1316786 RepID=A0A7D8USX2_9HELO|nr:hypothetical protein LCER1_G004185 [Lachnellula cervina]